MGFCQYHSVKPELDRAAFDSVVEDFGKLLKPLEGLGVNLAGGDGHGEPVIGGDEIRFNGPESEDGCCETFVLEQKVSPKGVFVPGHNGKCHLGTKTRQKPYDLAVMACLIVAKRHLGDDVEVRSDGTIEDWQKAVDLCVAVLGYGAGFALDDGADVGV